MESTVRTFELLTAFENERIINDNNYFSTQLKIALYFIFFFFFFEPTTNSKLLFLSFLLAPTVDGNNSPQNVPIPVTRNTNQIPVLTANAVTASIPVVTNHIPNGGVHVPHVRPRLPGGFPVRDSTISITPSDGIYGGGGLQSTQKGKYGNRDMKAELKDLEVDMDRITLGDLLEEGEEYLSIRLSEGSILLEQREKHHQKMSFC